MKQYIENYIPKPGDNIEVFHPEGMYWDRVTGNVTSQQYTVEQIDKSDTYGILLTSYRHGKQVLTNVELAWFNTSITGRKVKML
jgi:hypothetical protein